MAAMLIIGMLILNCRYIDPQQLNLSALCIHSLCSIQIVKNRLDLSSIERNPLTFPLNYIIQKLQEQKDKRVGIEVLIVNDLKKELLFSLSFRHNTVPIKR